jgi:hypothetical protein
MVVYTNKKYSNYLEFSRTVFTNFDTVPDFKDRLSGEGFDDEKMQQGRELNDYFESMYNSFLQAQQQRNSQRNVLNKAFNKFKREYRTIHQRVQQEYFHDIEFLELLGLTNPREKEKTKYIDQAANFFDVSLNNESVKLKLAEKKITETLLQRGKTALDGYYAAFAKYEEFNGTCQSIWQQRVEAYRFLKAFLDSLETSAKLAYFENPQELEKLKIFVRNKPAASKKTDEEPTEPTEPAEPTEPSDTTTTTSTTSTTSETSEPISA